ncbi:MAG: hypothetical protein OSJ52_07205 [Lachnospiraceae bacterium]|nr:hypothetical protein [Lachnospiraceae bacterium]
MFRDWYGEGLIDPNFISNEAALMPSAEYMGTRRAGASTNIWGLTADTYKLQGYNQEENFFLAGVTTPVLNEGDTAQIGMATSELTKETLSMYTLVTSDFGLYNWAMFDPMYEGMRTLEAYTPWNESKFERMKPLNTTICIPVSRLWYRRYD